MKWSPPTRLFWSMCPRSMIRILFVWIQMRLPCCWIILSIAEIRWPGRNGCTMKKPKDRDLAIVTLLLGTGIRVSECVGLDVEGCRLQKQWNQVTRKGGNEMVVYFGPEVEKHWRNIWKSGRILRLWQAMSTLSSILPNVAGSVFRLSRIWLKNMPGRSQLQKDHPA